MMFQNKTTKQKISSKIYDSLTDTEQREYKPIYDVSCNEDILMENEELATDKDLFGKTDGKGISEPDTSMDLFAGNNDLEKRYDCPDMD